MSKLLQLQFLHRRLEPLPRGEGITFNTPLLVDLERNQRMKRRRREVDINVGRPHRPAEEISRFILEFDKLTQIPPSERPATLPESMVATLSQWQNLKHTMDDPSIATAEYEGRKIGIQLFNQAQEMEAFAVLPKIIKWLEKIITDTYYNFTMPSKKDREESGSVYSWSHTQRLDYNFFTGMRSEIVGMVKDGKRARQYVPENCRGGFEHLVVSSDVQKSVPAPVWAQAPIRAAPQTQPLVDYQKRMIPQVFGGFGLRQPYNQLTTAGGTAITVLEGRQREEYQKSLTHVPHDQRVASTTGLATPHTENSPILGRVGEASATQGVGLNSSSQSAKDIVVGGIQVRGQSPITPGIPIGATLGPVSGALNYPVKNTDWVGALHHAIEKDKATPPYTSSPYSNQHAPEHSLLARPPPEQHNETSTTHTMDNKWMEGFVDLSGAAPPAKYKVMTTETGNKHTSPERVLFSVGDRPDVPRSNSAAPGRRGSDSTAPTEMGDAILSDAGSASVATSPEADMDEVDMIRTDHMGVTRSDC